MKVQLDHLEGLEKKLFVEVPEEKVKEAFNKVYSDLQKNVTLKGFRKGKAPLIQLKKVYGDRVRQDVLQELVSESFHKAVTEHTLSPVTEPAIEISAFDEDIAFKYSAVFEDRPAIVIKKDKDLVVEKEILKVEETTIDEALENIRKNFQTSVPVVEDRPAQMGDVSDINFDGYIDGEPLQGGKADGHRLELGSQSFIPGFEEQIVGMTVGQDREIQLKFPEDYHAKEIAGKPVTFKVKLNALFKKELPELNDEFALKLGETFKTLDDVKKYIRQDIEQSESQRIQEDLKQRLLKALVKENPVEVPKSLQVAQEKRLREDIDQRLKQQGMSEAEIKDYNEKWESEYSSSASTMIQSSFLVNHLAREWGLKASSAEVEEKIHEQSEQAGIPLEYLQEHYQKNPERESNLRFQIIESKVVEKLLSQAQIVEVPKEKLGE